MIVRVAVVALALVLGSCFPSPPTDISVRVYDVTGTTLDALERSLATHGPQVPGLPGRAFAAVETYFVHSFEFVEEQGRCRYGEDGRVGVRSEVILPEWRQRRFASGDLQARWDIISRYAVIHEAGHIRISQKYARILQGWYKVANAVNCAKLERVMAREAAKIMKQHRAEQRLFDATDGPRFERYLRSLGYTLGS